MNVTVIGAGVAGLAVPSFSLLFFIFSVLTGLYAIGTSSCSGMPADVAPWCELESAEPLLFFVLSPLVWLGGNVDFQVRSSTAEL